MTKDVTVFSAVRMVVGIAFVGCAVVALSASVPQAAPNTLTPAEKSAGWKLLFDGKTIDQWRGYKQPGVPEDWAVQDGTIVRVAEGPDLISRDEYTSFDFRFDWQIAAGANSGVMFHVTEAEDETYMTGPEYQLLDNKGHPDGASPLTSAGSCYALYAPPRDVTRPVGAWNEGRILIAANHVEHWLNGQKTASYELGSAEWNAKVAASKFKDWPGFGKAARGHLALQQHGGTIAFRNLKIKTTPGSR
jgi:3-keto-disaccharide hydrolase